MSTHCTLAYVKPPSGVFNQNEWIAYQVFPPPLSKPLLSAPTYRLSHWFDLAAALVPIPHWHFKHYAPSPVLIALLEWKLQAAIRECPAHKSGWMHSQALATVWIKNFLFGLNPRKPGLRAFYDTVPGQRTACNSAKGNPVNFQVPVPFSVAIVFQAKHSCRRSGSDVDGIQWCFR